MKVTGWLTLIVFLGGIFGYVKADSVPSLIMGVLFATILSVSAFMMFNQKKIGFYTGVTSSFVLFAFFLYRFVLTYKVMPAGLMCVLSLIVFVVLLLKRKGVLSCK